ncbi:hypothetical protein CEUSTIGMA_g583.t1 [Chlamydomonas eustigma]|uniref:30S ribosomal protein 3, chloroplastic n=1 Tax=Chlamydomonas eustigma TaxID=1157962 RepID=A0A250WRF8_9CHLO|nr:hypothetical protein CEUSTIGMA_g583.t1 [Chlamydomonas eustigma]|eukprot:GAX73130.1 hypothetical protein CEUSTIGMA_g583.t1 [Chlamydomonas eustigma]
MSSALMRRQGLSLGSCRISSRSGCLSRPAKPFVPVKNLSLRAAAPEVEGGDEDVFETEDIVQGELLDSVVQENQEEKIVLDDDARLAIQEAQEYSHMYNEEIIAEADLEGDDFSSKEALTAKAAAALETLLESGSESDVLLAIAGNDVAEAEGVEDKQGPQGFRKYDEEEASGMSEQQRQQVQPFKLTKTELDNLVPEDWDTINVDWFSNRKEDNIPLPEYKLAFIWTERNIAVAVDQVYSRGQISPLTEYFFWPRKDAWEELRVALEARPWISERDKVVLLNRTTEVINFWQQDEVKPTLDQVKVAFPDCSFMGSSSTPAPPPMPNESMEMAM